LSGQQFVLIFYRDVSEARAPYAAGCAVGHGKARFWSKWPPGRPITIAAPQRGISDAYPFVPWDFVRSGDAHCRRRARLLKQGPARRERTGDEVRA